MLIRKQILLEAALGILVLQAPISCKGESGVGDSSTSVGLLSAPPSKGGKALENLPESVYHHNTPSLDDSSMNKDTYTINFNNISIIEYLRFVSKISNLNFIFNEEDLQFSVSIVSEDPVTPHNIMSILIQVLRVHDLNVLEQDGNLLITKSPNTHQLATIVSSDLPEDSSKAPTPIVTRVFRIKNANLATVASIIKPMLSQSASLEVSIETKQLIITDITTNIDKISTLLVSLDTPHTSLEIDSYEVKNIGPAELIYLADQILAPFSEGNPLVFVPQVGTKTIFVVSTPYLIERALALFEDLDIPSKPEVVTVAPAVQNFYLYKIVNKSGPDLVDALGSLTSELKDRGGGSKLIATLSGAKYIKESNGILFVGDAATLDQVKQLMPDLDVVGKPKAAESKFLVYKLQHVSEEEMQSSIEQMADNLEKAPQPNEDLIASLHSMNYIKETNSLVFTGREDALAQLAQILPTFDIAATTGPSKSNFYLYKIQHTTETQIQASLTKMAKNLEKAPVPDKGLIDAIRSVQYIKETNSLIFTGSDDSLKKIADVVPTFDISSSDVQYAEGIGASQYMVYNPKYRSGDELQTSLKEIAGNLKESGLADPALLQAVNNMRWVPSTHSLIFTGTQQAMKQIQELLASMDTPTEAVAKKDVFLYKPFYVSKEQLQDALSQLASNLDPSSPSDAQLQNTINNIKWIDDSQSFLFRGDTTTLGRLKDLLTILDSPEGLTGGGANTFYLHKLEAAPCEIVIANLQRVAGNLKDSGIPNQALISTLLSARCIKDNNSILLTGSAAAIGQAKQLITQFDNSSVVPSAPGKSSFLIYKPEHQDPQTLQVNIQNIGKDLQSSGLIDPDLLLTIQTMRFVPSTNSLLFTGTPTSLDKIKELLSRLDVVSAEQAQIQQLGQLTFLIYKVQYVPPPQLIASLKGLATDLQKTGAIDQHTVDAINSLKWIKETNSILFVGSNETLQKVDLMVRKFDIPALAPKAEGGPPAPGNFIVYTPKFVPGDELIKILEDFEQNLVAAGVSDRSLFDSINNLKWIPRTCSLLVPGDDASIARVEELLHRFDVPSREKSPPVPAIEQIENTSFLIYKLQYHQGNEILSALKQVTIDIAKTGTGANQNLLNAINSLQWIRVTNSLLASGEADTLGKLKDLIQNLDVPLRQIFIEILVIETAIINTQNFGLQWGGRMQYLNRFGAGTGNFPLSSPNSASTNGSNNLNTGNGIATGINSVTTTQTPVTNNTNIPFMTGFDLGVIGDIIMHKGQSFISLGSLVNALQTDTDSTIVLNPKIITQDNRNSTIFVGSNIPFAGSFISTTQSFVSQTQNIEYRDIGFNLSITPTIGNNDIVTLDISNDISEVTNSNTSLNTSQSNISGITTSHTTMSTRVHVPDRHFVVLSGMIFDTKTRFRSQIPCLGGLPVIGVAFSENDRVNAKSNIIIFLRPQIVNTYQEYKEITDHQEQLYKDSASLPVLKEEFDAGVDMVKTSENE